MRSLRPLHWSLFYKSPTGLASRIKPHGVCLSTRRLLHLSHPPSDFPILLSQPSAEHQIYQSLSNDPYVNLAIENFLYKNTPNESKILFFYINRPTVVIGRNQNPWLETNLHLLKQGPVHKDDHSKAFNNSVILLRRRSGGGAVFHDEGNLNFSVICPKPIFHRDKHAEMVVRGLHKLGATNTSVNTRHDIVMSQDSAVVPPPTNVIPLRTDDVESPPVETTPHALKISGSAYKLSRFRALHHGTCLIDSPNLKSIGTFLKSPARPYLRAKGVESVRSPIGNVSSTLSNRLLDNDLMQSLVAKIMEEFVLLYNVDPEALACAQALYDEPGFRSGNNWAVGTVNSDNCVGINEIEADISEFKSLDWTFNQCPQFTFSTHPTEEDPRPRPELPPHLSSSTHVFLRLRAGKIFESRISTSADPEIAASQSYQIHQVLENRPLHEILDWRSIFLHSETVETFESPQEALKLAEWLNSKLGR